VVRQQRSTKASNQKKKNRLVVDAFVVVRGGVALLTDADAAAAKLGAGLGAQTPAGCATTGGCQRRARRVSF
jgi:hypothetical protein